MINRINKIRFIKKYNLKPCKNNCKSIILQEK